MTQHKSQEGRYSRCSTNITTEDAEMEFRLKQHYSSNGSVRIPDPSPYIMMRSLEITTGQTWVIEQTAFKLHVRNTFKDLKLNVVNIITMRINPSYWKFDDAVGFDGLKDAIHAYSTDPTFTSDLGSTIIEFDLYPTIANIYADEDTFQQVNVN